MNDLGPRLRDALQHRSQAVVPQMNEQDLARRVRARRRRRNFRSASVGVILLTVTLVVARHDPAPRERITTASSTAGAVCAAPAALPFMPTNLPDGWRQGPYDGSELWTMLSSSGATAGVIEVWNGQRNDLPEPALAQPITVLGRTAQIGSISDGYSMVVQLGPTRCDRWALIAHPSVTLKQLEVISTGLVARETSVTVASVPTSPSVARTLVPVAVTPNATYRLVLRYGRDLVDLGGTTVATLPAVVGDSPVLLAAEDHLIVQAGIRVFVYDTRTWAQPTDAGTYAGLGEVVPTATGFWAADIPASGSAPLVWQLHGWDGAPIGPSITASKMDDVPLLVGVLDDGIVLTLKGTSEILVAGFNGVRSIGVGDAIAALGTSVAWASAADGDVNVYSATTRTTRSVAHLDGLSPAQSFRAGAFSPDGRFLAVSLAQSALPYASGGLLLVDLVDATRSVRLDQPQGNSAVWTKDNSAVLISDNDSVTGLTNRVTWFDPTNRSSIELPIKRGPSSDHAVLSP